MKRYGLKILWLIMILTFLMSGATVLFHPDYGGKFASKAGDADLIAKGKALFYSKKCYACHGSNGRDPITETFPILAGQTATYLDAQIHDILNGYRNNGMSSQMKSAVGALTDDEIRAVSHFLSSAK